MLSATHCTQLASNDLPIRATHATTSVNQFEVNSRLLPHTKILAKHHERIVAVEFCRLF